MKTITFITLTNGKRYDLIDFPISELESTSAFIKLKGHEEHITFDYINKAHIVSVHQFFSGGLNNER